MTTSRFPVAQNNPFKISGVEEWFETEVWYCCRPWEIVRFVYTWDAELDRWKGEAFHIRKCGLCGQIPQPRMEDRF